MAFEITIEKLVYGGEGLGRLNGRAVLVPLVLPGERVSARPVKEEPRLVRALAEQILEPSPGRVTAECPYFTRCGGCQYQHARYEDQLRYKAAILRETLARIGKLEAPEPEVVAAEPWHYRNRVQFKAGKRGREFHLGYFERGSRRLLDVDQCPISAPEINALLPELGELGRRPDFPEGPAEIELFVAPEGALLARITSTVPVPETLVSACREHLPGLVSLAAEAPGSGRPRRIFGPGHLVYSAGGFDYRVSHGVFFQSNRFLTDTLAELVTGDLEGEAALDLFSGAGYFTLPLARRFARVVAVESNRMAVRDLDSNCSRAGLGNVEVVHSKAENFLTEAQRPDAVLLDPPRAGVGKAAIEALARLDAPAIIYVSCDPATLARDLAPLVAHYRLERLQLVDLFPQTFHIEAVATLVRQPQ